MPCRLCLNERPLVRSHIIPESIFKLIYDPQPQRFWVVSSDSAVKTTFEQKGVRERLLCRECDNKLSKWEDYVARLLKRAAPFPRNPLGRLELDGIDYIAFKLFQLSILWRASITRLPFFADVKLSQEHEERLRQMILLEDPGSPEDYGCFLTLCVPFRKVMHRFMLSPETAWDGENTIIRFIFGGFIWHYLLGRAPDKYVDERPFINEDGVLPILLDSKHCFEYMLYWFVKLKESGNLPEVANDED